MSIQIDKPQVEVWPVAPSEPEPRKFKNRMARRFMKAADLIRNPANWVQRSYRTKDYETDEWRYCAIGAVTKAFEGYGSYAVDILEQAMKSVTPRTRATAVEQWNDARGRKHEDVVAMLERAAEIAETNRTK